MSDEVRDPAMASAVAALLAEVDGDAAMEFECDTVLLQRLGSQVTVNAEWDESQWPRGLPCRGLLRRSMPSAALAVLPAR